jgi:nodulation protein F
MSETDARWGDVRFWKGAMADKLADDIISKIKEHADPTIGEIGPATELTSLGIHSLELTEIIFDLEEAYGIEIEMSTVEAWSNLKTVHDMIEAVRALIAKKA